MALSLLAEYDDLIKCSTKLAESSCEAEFIQFALNQENCRQKWLSSVVECQRLKEQLEELNKIAHDLESKLNYARFIIDSERKERSDAQKYSAGLEKKLQLVRELVFVDGGAKINDETKEKLGFLNSTCNSFLTLDTGGHVPERQSRLNTICEAMDSTGSLLSDLSFSRSEDDDIGGAQCKKVWKKHRPSLGSKDAPTSAKKHRSSGIEKTIELDIPEKEHKVVATTTLTVAREGSITASAKLEAVPENKDIYKKEPITKDGNISINRPQPSAPPKGTDSVDSDETAWGVLKTLQHTPRNVARTDASPSVYSYGLSNKINMRSHVFCSKTVMYPECCEPCGKRIKFGKLALKCRECKTLCHPMCKEQVPLPCVPIGNTPTRRGGIMGAIADYTPKSAPMIPALIVHCANEVDQRGFSEVGIYRVPGADRDVKLLKEKFLKGKGVPNLSKVDIHVLCGTIKDFLRSLAEPLVTYTFQKDFIKAASYQETEDGRSLIYQAISEIPQPNRDTLAFLIMHLQRVAESPECKMPISNLAKVFGPTIVGYSNMDLEPAAMLNETNKQVAVMELLMSIPSDYWSNFGCENSGSKLTSELFYTPTSEYLPPTSGSSNMLTPATRSFKNRGIKFFGSPC